MQAPPRFVRRVPHVPLVRLGERERTVAPRLGAAFPAYPAKEGDLVLDLEGVKARARHAARDAFV